MSRSKQEQDQEHVLVVEDPSTSANDESTPLLIGRENSIQARAPPKPSSRATTSLSSTSVVDRFGSTSTTGTPGTSKGRPKLQTLARFVLQASSFSDSERHRHKLHCATHLGAAASLVRDCVLGDEVENPADGAYDPYSAPNETDWEKFRNAVAFLCRRWCPAANRLLWTALAVLTVLTFLEPPHWCRDSPTLPYGGCETYLRAKGVPAGADDLEPSILVPYYPSTDSMCLTVGQSHEMETLCLILIVGIVLMRLGRDGFSIPIYLRSSRQRTNRILELVSVIILGLGVLDEWLGAGRRHIVGAQFHPYVRGVLLASSMLGMQRDLNVLVDMVPRVFNILVLLFLVMLFYAWFGVVMFVDTDEGDQLFPSLVEGLWTLWICVTTANYPDVMMPGYNDNRWVALYFVSFMIITFFFLMNIILAAVVNEYDSNVDERRTRKADYARTCLQKAYTLLIQQEAEDRAKADRDESASQPVGDSTLSPPGSSSQREQIDKKTVMALFEILNSDFPEFRCTSREMYLSDEEKKLLFAVLDRDGSSRISATEFMDFGSVLMLEFVKAEEYMTFIERQFPAFYNGSFWRGFGHIVKSPYFEYAVDLILLLNAIVVGIQTWPELASSQKVHIDEKYWDGSIDTVWELVEAIFTVVYVLEALIKVAVFGWKHYSEEMKNMFDLLITTLAVVSSVIVYCPNNYSDSRLIRMVLTARVLRLFRLLTALKSFQLIGKVSAEILPAATGVIGLLFLIMYFYAALGMHLYGGLISRDPNNEVSHLILGSDFAESDYWANNFNDMISGMNALFNLLVVNNWMVCEVGFEAATDAKWVRLFFLSFHILGVILVNNLVIAFVISNFLTQYAIMKENVGPEIVEGETIIQDRKALFDAKQITGTKTNLTGAYIARLRYFPTSEVSGSNHQHARLRQLFTQQSSLESPDAAPNPSS